METISPPFDPLGSSIGHVAHLTSSPSAITSPSVPAPPSPPRRQTISSASEMPQKDLKAAIFSQHVAPQQYIDHHRKALELLRQQHREERAMWDIERQELLLKVAELEAKITRIVHLGSPDIPSIADKLSKYSLGSTTSPRSSSVPSSFTSSSCNRERSMSPAGTRGGSASVEKAALSHMESIPESAEQAKSVTFRVDSPAVDEHSRELESLAVPGELVDKDLDGVMIKITSLPSAIQQAILKESHSATPSPLHSPSPTKTPLTDRSATPQRPVTIEIPSTQKVLQLPSKELYTHAAGHTPMARIADSAEGTGSATPVIPEALVTGQEKPPPELQPSTQDAKPLRPPNERSDSYFNVPIPEHTEHPLESTADARDVSNIPDLPDDPALSGPLNLGTGDFLSKLDEKLASLSMQQGVQNQPSLPDSDAKQREGNDPPLRIKRSLNFGSAWGSVTAGKNV